LKDQVTKIELHRLTYILKYTIILNYKRGGDGLWCEGPVFESTVRH